MNDVPGEHAPIPDAPPWDDDDAPPPYGEPVVPPPRQSSQPPAPPTRKVGIPAEPPKPSGSSGLWSELAEQYKNKLTPMFWYILDDAKGVLEGDQMVVHCGDDFTLETLNCAEVSQVIRDVTGEKLGRPVTVRFVVGGMDAVPQTDKLDDLIRAGKKYPEFKVN